GTLQRFTGSGGLLRECSTCRSRRIPRAGSASLFEYASHPALTVNFTTDLARTRTECIRWSTTRNGGFMKTNRIAMLTILALAASAQIARAEMTRPVRPDLRAAQQTLAWRAQNSKGGQRDSLNSEERKVDALINDLE